MASSGGSPGPSPNSNPTPSSHFDVQKLFKPPPPSSNPNPNPIPRGTSPFLPPPSSYPAPLLPSAPPSAPLSAFSYPPSTPPFQHRPFLHYPQAPSPIPIPNPNPNAGARLMALLGTAQPANIESAISMPSPTSPSEFTVAPGNPPILHPPPPAILQPDPARLPSSKLPRGRRLAAGDRAVYDVDSRFPGESQPPQLEVTPITKYISDPGLVLGRQIALNRVYICYGLKLGAIRVLNINTALRSLLRGHTQKVTDMTFFAEDVPLLASASIDGRIFVWKINEDFDDDSKPQITGKIVLAIQIIGAGEGEPYHPRVCWHPHKQEVLVVGVGNYLLKIDTIKVGRIGQFSAEEPVRCPIDKLIDGVQLIGKHDGEITDISMSQWMTTRLASASKDGKVKIWEDRKVMPIATLTPHDNQPVSSAAFMTSPERPDHIILVTAGPLNRELKIWVSASEEGWLLPSDCESWKCNQTLDLRSSTEPRLEEAFFNQFVVLSRASFILLANAKKNAIYALHVDYGPNPASTRMDYIADFTVTMPILSFTGTSDCFSDTEQIVQVYCVQTQAIQQYALDLSQCLPIPVENEGSEKQTSPSAFDGRISEGFSVPHSSSGATNFDAPFAHSSPKSNPINRSEDNKHQAVSGISEATVVHELVTSNVEPAISAPQLSSVDKSTGDVVSSSLPLNLDLSEKLPVLQGVSGAGEQENLLSTGSVDSQGYDSTMDTTLDGAVISVPDVPPAVETSVKEKNKAALDAIPLVPNPHVLFKPDGKTAHLVTPSEILSGVIPPAESSFPNHGLRSEELDARKVTDKNVMSHVDGKVVGDRALIKHDYLDSEIEPQEAHAEQGKLVKLPSSEPINFVEKKAFKTEERDAEGIHILDNTVSGKLDLPSDAGKEVVEETIKKDAPFKHSSIVDTNSQPTSDLKSNRPRENLSQASGSLSPISGPFASDSLVEPVPSIGNHSTDVLSQLRLMQELLNQLATNQKEIEKQMAEVVSTPVMKEGRRLEAAFGQSLEKSIKANMDSLWAHIQEDNAKQEKTERENMQQLTSLITNCINKDIPAAVERTIRKEISALGQVLARAITPSIEKCISSAIGDSFQRGVTDKTVSQLEKTIGSKLEASLARQIQSQFQTSGKQTLQDTLKSTLESSVVPTFEKSCRGLFEQIDEAFKKGLTDHMAVAQQQYESAHTQLSLTLKDAINSASSITQNLVSELTDGQQKLLAHFAAGNTKANAVTMQQINGPLGGHPDMALSVQQIEAPVDPTKELTRLISERKFDEAFTLALQRSDVSIVSWLCSQVDLHGLCSMAPLPLSQGVLLALLQQLSCDTGAEAQRKLGWMTDVAVAINPTDPMITSHVRPIFEQVYSRLLHQRTLQTTTVAEASSIRLIIHVINSVLMSCK